MHIYQPLDSNSDINKITFPISPVSSHHDHGVILPSDISWSLHYSNITSKPLNFLPPTLKLSIYCSFIHPKPLYSSQVWRPHHVKDIKSFAHVQHLLTKFILSDYTSTNKDHLITLPLLPLSLWMEYITFLIKCFKDQPFNTFNHIQFTSSNTHSSSSSKLNVQSN